MDFLDKKIEDYALLFTSPENEIMNELNRETHLNKLQPRMLSGHLQGSFLKMLSKMIRPKNILEIGTYTGYSAIALASGLQENGAALFSLSMRKQTVEIKPNCMDKKLFKSVSPPSSSCVVFERVGELINSTLATAARLLHEIIENIKIKIIRGFFLKPRRSDSLAFLVFSSIRSFSSCVKFI